MSLELSGTTGVKGVAGSVSAPSIVGDDTNTGISFPSADTIKFSTGGVERMSITNSGVSGTGIGGGKILQVKYGFRTGHLSTTSTSYVDSGITVDITPSASTSKVLILINYLGGVNGGSTGGQEHQVRILRDSTEIFTERTADFMRFMVGNAQADYMIAGQFLQNLDSPSTTSAITYKLQCKRSGTGTQNVWAGSNICVMEVAA